MISRYTERSTGTSAEGDDPGGHRGSRQHRRTVRSTVLISSKGCLLFLSFISEVKGCILEHLDYESVFQLKSLSKSWKLLIESDEFIHALSRRKQATLTACYCFIESGVWQWAGFDPNWRENSSSIKTVGKWRRLPPLASLPANCDPDADLFKEFLVCSKNGLVCMNFSKSPHEERLIVFNPLTQHWTELPPLLHRRKGCILEHLDYESVFQLKSLSKSWKLLIESDEFIHALSRRKQATLTACYCFMESGVWQWAGFDPNWRENSSSIKTVGKWRRLPPLASLPANCDPDADLFKEFFVCSRNGLVCMNFSKSPHEERLIVFNPLTQHWTELSPLLHRRNPVLMHMLVDQATHSYRILVAGSSGSGNEHLSKLTELYDSRTERWERVDDVPGPAFALNDYQSGVYQNGNIFCIGFVELHEQMVKGILGFSIADRKWSTQWTERALPSSAILQLVENSGELFLFSERENDRFIEHWVDRLELVFVPYL